MFWRKNPTIAVRTRLSVAHAMARVWGHIAERGTSVGGHLQLTSGTVGVNTFTVRYTHQGSRYKVLGRFREGPRDRLLLLRVVRLPEKAESIAWSVLGGVSVWFGSRGLEVGYDFLWGARSVVSAIVSGRVMPRWHRVPTEIVVDLEEDYLRVVDGTPRSNDSTGQAAVGRITMK